MKVTELQSDYLDSEGKPIFIQIPHYFERIPKLYSVKYPNGIKFSMTLQKLFCYLEGWNRSNTDCFQSQDKLSNVLNATRKTVCESLQLLVDLHLVEKINKKKGRGFIYKALPLTDAHVTPPGQIQGAIAASVEQAPDEVTAPLTEAPTKPDEGKQTFMQMVIAKMNLKRDNESLRDFIERLLQDYSDNDFTKTQIETLTRKVELEIERNHKQILYELTPDPF